MDITLAQKAINLALNGDWEAAIEANLEILKINDSDIDALNRLAKAYAETGQMNLAKGTSQKVLEIDPVNTIAAKCLDKWNSMNGSFKKQSGSGDQPSHENLAHQNFIEESGKTKLVTLLHPGDTSVLADLDSGDEVKLETHPHSISVVNSNGKYLGRLPDDIAARLRSLIKQGNKYLSVIKSIKSKDVILFIKETEKGKNVKSETSFPTEKIDYVSFTPPELVHKDEPIMDITEASAEE